MQFQGMPVSLMEEKVILNLEGLLQKSQDGAWIKKVILGIHALSGRAKTLRRINKPSTRRDPSNSEVTEEEQNLMSMRLCMNSGALHSERPI